MKIWNNILFVGISVCLLFLQNSCSNDDNPGNPSDAEGNAFLSFQLNTNPAGIETRAIGYDYGTEQERKVSTVHILLYDLGNLNLLHTIEIQAKTDGKSPFTGNDVAKSSDMNGFTTKAIELKKQDYQLLALINAPAKILANAKAQKDHPSDYNTLQDMLNAVNGVPSDFYDGNKENFFMSNAGGMVTIPESAFVEEKAFAENNPVTIPVDRLLAKVLVYENTSNKIEEIKLGGTLGEITWGLHVSNKQTYPVRVPDKLKDGTQETGFYSTRKDIYAKDPNFTGNEGIVTDNNEKEKHFNYADPSVKDGFVPWITFEDKNKPAAYYQYVFENTLSVDDQNAKTVDPGLYTTQVMLKVIITEPGKDDKKLTGVKDYYSYTYKDDADQYHWIVFTHEQAVEWFTGSYPSDMVILKTNEVFKKAQELQNSPFDFTDKTNGAPDKFTTTELGLTYHKDGLNVYRIPIMHFGTDGASIGDYGYYGVVRNNTYQVVILSINGPGINTTNDGFISTAIAINEWYDRDWEEEL